VYSCPHPITGLEGEDLSPAITVIAELLGGLGEDRAPKSRVIVIATWRKDDNLYLALKPNYHPRQPLQLCIALPK